MRAKYPLKNRKLFSSHSLATWASELSILLRETLSYNGMKYAQDENQDNSVKALLQFAMNQQSKKTVKPKLTIRLLEKINRVFLEDRTCINLPCKLHKFFPVSFSHKGNAATAKIQLQQELKSSNYSNLELQSFRDNDQKIVPDILNNLAAS
jgi:hypothetical protein